MNLLRLLPLLALVASLRAAPAARPNFVFLLAADAVGVDDVDGGVAVGLDDGGGDAGQALLAHGCSWV